MRFRRLSHRHGEGGETHEKSPGPGHRLSGVRPSGMRRAAADLCFSQKQGKDQLSLLRLSLLYAAPPLWRHAGGGGGVCLSGLAHRGRLGTDCRILSAGLCAGGRPPDGAGPVPGQGGAFGPFSRWSGSSAPSTTGPTTSGTPPGTCCGGQRRTTRFCRQTASAWSFPSSERPAATGWTAAFGCRWSRRRAGGTGWWCALPGDMTRRT